MMRVSNVEKDKSRERIVAAAARMFREQGAAGAGLGEIMRAAGMTHGGFYRHFPDKDALMMAALGAAFDEFAKPLLDTPAEEVPNAIDAFRRRYLSAEHVNSPGEGCPIVALAPDIARMDAGMHEAFSAGVKEVIEGLARRQPATSADRTAAWRELAMMAGAVLIARAATEDVAREVLAACAPSTWKTAEID